MRFNALFILPLLTLATAIPAPEPVAEPLPEPAANLETRTFWWNWLDQYNCNCECSDGNYKRSLDGSVLEARTFWKLPSPKDQCEWKCKKKCNDEWEQKKQKCKKDAYDAYCQCKDSCKYKRNGYNPQPSCKDQCKITYDNAVKWCEGKYSY